MRRPPAPAPAPACATRLTSPVRPPPSPDLSDAGSDADSDVDDDAYLEYRSIPHVGTVNRVRAQPLPSSSALPPVDTPYHTATFSETGKVHIFDVRPLIESLDVPGYMINRDIVNQPAYTVNNHGRHEGYALDWAGGGNGEGLRLLSGDVASKIYLTTSTQSGFTTSAQAFASHTSSVEDIQWSPSERTVFASCSADRSIKVWDVRQKGRKNAVGVEGAHDSDVNVISWNKAGAEYLLVSGGDEGAIKVWDLRNFKACVATPSPPAALSCFCAEADAAFLPSPLLPAAATGPSRRPSRASTGTRRR